MTAKRAGITQAEIQRAVRGATAGGIKVGRIEIEGTKLVLHAITGDDMRDVTDPAAAWEAEYRARQT